ncbi:MAG TPA: MnhB domain-containing protein [Devosiaceae bacterium]|jgi:multicomponent Na+:H+ antiporter subunit B|nr:MnhB domain-containing protein [Devosiaceae bacterium]
MNSLIFRTAAPLIVIVMLVFSAFVLLRGHNEPGGGFIAGLIAAAAVAVYGMAAGVEAVERALHVPPLAIAGSGVVVAVLAGLLSVFVAAPFLTGLWTISHIAGVEVALSTPMLFDFGVFLSVFGTVSAIFLTLEAGEPER